MVFFTCNACGQSIKKNQVESHCSFQCRNCQSVSCMDCNKEFWGNDYKEHIKCISEDQKYGGKDYKPKASSNKGEVKQEKWIEHINSTITTRKLSGRLSGLLEQIIQYSNIPRKKSKFENFLKNSLKIRDNNLVAEAWEVFAQSTKNESDASNNNPSVNGINGSNPANGTNSLNSNSSSNASLKRPSDDVDSKCVKKMNSNSSQSNKENQNKFDSFNWCAACEEILQQHPSGLPEKKLRKQVIAKYKACVGDSCTLSDDELKSILRRELSNNSTFSLYTDSSKV